LAAGRFFDGGSVVSNELRRLPININAAEAGNHRGFKRIIPIRKNSRIKWLFWIEKPERKLDTVIRRHSGLREYCQLDSWSSIINILFRLGLTLLQLCVPSLRIKDVRWHTEACKLDLEMTKTK
jgi:hypothetical protein